MTPHGDADRSGSTAGDGSPVTFEAACFAYLVVLAVISIALALAVNWLDWTVYTLVRDLPWTAVVAWGVGTALARVQRRWPSKVPLVDPFAWPSTTRRAVAGTAFVLATLAVLAPLAFSASWSGLSLRVAKAWRSTESDGPARLVSRLHFDDTSGHPWAGRPLAIALTGWVYAPIEGQYHFELNVRGDALLEIDGIPFMGRGEHGANLRTPWATDSKTGARRAAIDLQSGFHRVTVSHRLQAGPARFGLRWTPPYLTRYRSIRADFLLADGASARGRAARTLALRARRAGLVAMALLTAAPLTVLLLRPRYGLAWLARPFAFPAPGSGQAIRTDSARSSDVDRAS